MFGKLSGLRSSIAIFAGTVALLTLAPGPKVVSADASSGTQTEGAWYGLVSFTIPGVGSGTFPFLAHFNQDGTWTSDDARALGLGFGGAPPIFQLATTLTGSWVRTGSRRVAWRGVEVLKSSTPIPIGPGAFASWFLLVGHGSHEIAPTDPDHAINGNGGTTLYVCPPVASVTGFACPSYDDILSGAATALPGFPPFTFELTRIRAN